MLQYDISRSPNYIDSDIKAATITIMADITYTGSFNLKRKQTECLRHQTKSQYLSLVWRLTDNSSLAILHFFLVSWSFLWLLTMTTSCFLWLLQRSGRMEVSLRVLTRVWF